MRRPALGALLPAVGLLTVAGLALAPAPAWAAIDLTPGVSLPNPFDVGIPGPGELVGKVFEFFFKTFFGLEAKVTRRAVDWLIAHPVYTDTGQYRQLGQLRAYVSAGGWALFTLSVTVSAIRYWASGFTSGGAYEALEGLVRSGVAAGALVAYPALFEYASVLSNQLSYALTHAPGVESGLTKLLAAALVGNFTPLGIGALASVVAVVVLILLIVTKIVIATVLALLFVAAPLAIALWPLPEVAWLGRMWLQALFGVLLWPVIWALCFALFAVMGDSAFRLEGSFGSELIKPWVTVAALFVAFHVPRVVLRQAMVAGLAPTLGNGVARAAFYGRSALHAGGGGAAAARGAEGVSGRFGGGQAAKAATGA